MENLIYFLSGAVAILALWLCLMNIKFRRIRKNFEKFQGEIRSYQDEIKKFQSEMTVMEGRIKQAEGIELDFSVLDDKIEENTQQLFAAFREKVYELSRRMGDLEEDMNFLDEKLVENQAPSDSEE